MWAKSCQARLTSAIQMCDACETDSAASLSIYTLWTSLIGPNEQNRWPVSEVPSLNCTVVIFYCCVRVSLLAPRRTLTPPPRRLIRWHLRSFCHKTKCFDFSTYFRVTNPEKVAFSRAVSPTATERHVTHYTASQRPKVTRVLPGCPAALVHSVCYQLL